MNAQPAMPRALVGNALVLVALFALALVFARWQSDAWWMAAPRVGRWVLATLVLLAYLGLCVAIATKAKAQSRGALETAGNDADALLLAWASQTGFAEQLAEHTAKALREAGVAVRALPLHRVDIAMLKAHRRALFIASTTGEGDPPDHALGFTRHVLDRRVVLDGLAYGVLALGDRNYTRFCAFGQRLEQWLHHQGARPLFDRIDVDAGDDGALRHWQHRLGALTGRTELADWSAPAYRPWRLQHRRCLNPGSSGGPAFHVSLVPEHAGDLDWQAGDIVEIGPRQARSEVEAWLRRAGLDGNAIVRSSDGPQRLVERLARSRLPSPALAIGQHAQTVADALQALPHREYSIASLPSDGSLQLLVRQMRHDDGRLGLGSGWLTAHAAIDERVDVRVRSNRSFHAPSDDRPVILIGNGTGLAGLRALMKARVAAGHGRNWLVFGERERARDYHFGDEIEHWLETGQLQHLDLVFSRDQPHKRYVQDVLREQMERLREWLLVRGASVYVCGSLEGMAPAVDAALREAVGLDTLEAMAAEGRYCRDVY